MVKTLVVIPARYGSSRFPGKPLAKIAGKEMLLRVFEIAKKGTEGFDAHIVVGGGIVNIVDRGQPEGAVPCQDHQHHRDNDTNQIGVAAPVAVDNSGESKTGYHTHDAGGSAADGGIITVGLKGNGHIGDLVTQDGIPGIEERNGTGYQ
jgi:hypothetical protein